MSGVDVTDPVTICVPAYNSTAVLEETLDSALSQSWPNTHILVSVDQSTDDTLGLVKRFASKHSQIRFIAQDRRQGWVGNCNRALAAATTRFAMILPHDDLIDGDYVSTCLEALAAHQGAALAYSDLIDLDRPELRIVEPGELGTVTQRAEGFLRRHFDAVGFRGVVDRMVARRHFVPTYATANFAADTLFVGQMAAQGAILRVPEAMYRKRFLPQSAHAGWTRADADERDEMWVVHCLELVRTFCQFRPDLLFNSSFRSGLRSRLMSEEVTFRRSGPPANLTWGRPLLPQIFRIWAKVRMRSPSYKWLG